VRSVQSKAVAQVLAVALDGLHTNEEFVSGLWVGEAAGAAEQHLCFAPSNVLALPIECFYLLGHELGLSYSSPVTRKEAKWL